MYKVSSEQQERIANASYVASYLAQKGFTVYTAMYQYRIEVEVHVKSYNEVLMVVTEMKPRQDLYKHRDIQTHKKDNGEKWYSITMIF